MSNLFDYLDWRGDVPFQVDPFNEVDNLVLSVLAYVELDSIVPGPGWDGDCEERSIPDPGFLPRIGIGDVCSRFWEKHTEEEVRGSGTFYRESPFILKKLCSGARFRDMQLAGFVNRISETDNEQMSAVCCFLSDGTVYVSFRGTDDTLVGWKEDFYFSFKTGTAGQQEASKYLSSILRNTGCPVRVGGHSKGGNFAVYAAAFCEGAAAGRIIDVYTNDGPGFLKNVLETAEYQKILPLVHSILPEESLFGLILESNFSYKVVTSSRKGIMQHDALSWKVRRNRFEEAPRLSEASVVAEKTLETWLRGLSMKERKDFVNIVFSVLGDSGLENVSEIGKAQFRVLPELVKSWLEMDKKDKRVLRDAISRFLRTGATSLTEELKVKLFSGREKKKDSDKESNNEKENN